MDIIQLPIEQIVLPDIQLRSEICEQKLSELANSIEAVGLLQPILVMEKQQKYQLVSGTRRFVACKQLGEKIIPAIVLSSDQSIRQIQIIENVQREDLNPVDRAVVIKLLLEEKQMSKTQLSYQLGVPRTTLNDWLAIIDLNPHYQQAVVNNYYGGSSPLTLSHISLAKRFAKKMGSSKLVNAVLDAVLYYGINRTETRKVLKLVACAKDLSIDQAVRKVRLIPKERQHSSSRDNEWHWDTLVSSLTKSGDYLVKTNRSKLLELTLEQRQELVRKSKALQKLLDQVVQEIDDTDKDYDAL